MVRKKSAQKDSLLQPQTIPRKQALDTKHLDAIAGEDDALFAEDDLLDVASLEAAEDSAALNAPAGSALRDRPDVYDYDALDDATHRDDADDGDSDEADDEDEEDALLPRRSSVPAISSTSTNVFDDDESGYDLSDDAATFTAEDTHRAAGFASADDDDGERQRRHLAAVMAHYDPQQHSAKVRAAAAQALFGAAALGDDDESDAVSYDELSLDRDVHESHNIIPLSSSSLSGVKIIKKHAPRSTEVGSTASPTAKNKKNAAASPAPKQQAAALDKAASAAGGNTAHAQEAESVSPPAAAQSTSAAPFTGRKASHHTKSKGLPTTKAHKRLAAVAAILLGSEAEGSTAQTRLKQVTQIMLGTTDKAATTSAPQTPIATDKSKAPQKATMKPRK